MFGFGLPELIALICIFAPFVLWVIALIDIIKSDFAGNNKILWIIVVLLLPLLGAILYFFVGRKQRVTPSFAAVSEDSARKFCSECGEGINSRAEICPKCGVRQLMPKKSSSSAVAIIVVVILAGLGSIAVIGIMSAIAIPQFASYRQKAYNSAALTDLKNVKTGVEAHYADKGKYPASLDQITYIPSTGVSVAYEKTGKDGYVITSVHNDGDKVYLGSSDGSQILWRNAKDEQAEFTPI